MVIRTWQYYGGKHEKVHFAKPLPPPNKRPDGDNEDDRHLPSTETSLDELLVGEGGCADQASLKIPKANIFGKVITLNYN